MSGYKMLSNRLENGEDVLDILAELLKRVHVLERAVTEIGDQLPEEK